MSQQATPAKARRALIAGSVGNFIEWYEFGVYGFLATAIAANFFAQDGGAPLEALIRTYASFALAFFFRPLGAWLFGRLGDRFGRRPVLIAVLVLMSVATTLIGVLPTAATVGAAAPVLLTCVRVLQGLSAGGEFGGAVAVMTEFAPPGRRGRYGAWQSFTVALGLLAGAGTVWLVGAVLGADQLQAWGWRIPFLLALPLGAVALFLRLRLDETPQFERLRAADPGVVEVAPLGETVRAIGLGIARLMGWAAAGYTFLVVLPAYLEKALGSSVDAALTAAVLANLGFAAAILPAGWASDRVGRRPIMLLGAGATLVLALPLLWLLSADVGIVPRAIGLLLAGASVGLMAGPGPAMLSEMFPTSVRYTGLGLSYSLANAVFSGSAGLIITQLVAWSGNKAVPAYYVMITCAVSFVALLSLPRKPEPER
ncbi:MFS family permease [Naumannella cuiyingiana]|uniref:MFS family permease n=1 Tax=Naumannella cuiyingiana TaxID=1347891 RepID=A0A7Z0D7Y2_9ACTN|nr:MFS transporter [Naumannella cuiyingiana]NYI70559.1 MFS family permease [Naumannella cuiyingiana]